jgi:predicted transcriptional regulator
MSSLDIRLKKRGEMTVLVEVHSDQPINEIKEASNLTDALYRAESQCKDCKTSSPMVCVERCDVWRMKHEILEIRKVTGESTHTRRLLNALKSDRRLKILGFLCERSSSVGELQRFLREEGFLHSRTTIFESYVKPLTSVGLVREDGVTFKATFYGRKVHSLLTELGSLDLLPTRSCCYEEVVLRELNTPRTFDELATRVPPRSLSRILIRLRVKRLLAERPNSHYVFYQKAKGRPKMRLSPTERRVFDAIPQVGIPVNPLSSVVGINLRRTYKYLRRLREKKLVFALRTKRTYELTAQGRELLKTIDRIEKIADSSLNIPVPIPQQTS